MKSPNHKLPPIVWICFIATVLISAVALIFSIAAINGNNLEFDYNNTIGFAGIIFAVAGVIITIYFVTFGHKTFEIYKKMSDTEDIMNSVNSDMRNNLTETMNLLSSIRGITYSKKKLKYLLLAEGRLLCSSRFSTDNEKETGIGYLQQYSDKQDDIELLEKVANEAKKNNNTKIKDAAETAIIQIKTRIHK